MLGVAVVVVVAFGGAFEGVLGVGGGGAVGLAVISVFAAGVLVGVVKDFLSVGGGGGGGLFVDAATGVCFVGGGGGRRIWQRSGHVVVAAWVAGWWWPLRTWTWTCT